MTPEEQQAQIEAQKALNAELEKTVARQEEIREHARDQLATLENLTQAYVQLGIANQELATYAEGTTEHAIAWNEQTTQTNRIAEVTKNIIKEELGVKEKLLLTGERANKEAQIGLAAAQKQSALANAQLAKLERLGELEKKSAAQKQLALELGIVVNDQGEFDVDLYIRRIKAAKDLVTETEREAIARERAANAAQKTEDKQRAGANAADDLWTKLTGVSQQSQTFLGSLIRAAAEGDDLTETLGGFAEKWKRNIKDGAAAMDSLMSKAQEGFIGLAASMTTMFMAFDQSVTDLARSTTQFDRDFSTEIEGIQRAGADLGVTYDEAAVALSDLFASSKGFNTLSVLQQKSAAALAAQFAKLGVDTRSFGNVLTVITKTFQGTVAQTATATTRLTALARVIGREASPVVEEFTQSMSTLARYTLPEATANFEKLSYAAAQAGTDVSTLLSIAKGFETFDSAADKVANLNAILGGPFLNTIDMMNLAWDDPAAAVAAMTDALEQSEKSWDTLGPAMKAAIAEAAGISDMDVAAKVFGSKMSIDAARAAIDAEANSMDALAEKAKENLSIQEMMKAVMQEVFAGLDKEEIRDFFKNLAELMKTLVGLFNTLGAGGAATFGIIIMAAMPLISVLANVTTALVGSGGLIKALGAARLAGHLTFSSIAMGAMRVVGLLGGLYMAYQAFTAEDKGAGSVMKGAAGGAMIGASFGGVPGAVIGGIIGGSVTGIQALSENYTGNPYTAAGTYLDISSRSKVQGTMSERGVEAVNLPQGSTIIPSQTTNSMISTTLQESSERSTREMHTVLNEMRNQSVREKRETATVLKRNLETMNSVNESLVRTNDRLTTTEQSGQKQEVTMVLNDRVFGKAWLDTAQKVNINNL